MDVLDNPKIQVDHIEGIKLDCRKSKLRLATNQQNMWNKGKKKNPNGYYSSKFKGVSWHKRDQVWAAYIAKDYKLIHLGYHKDEIEAAKLYDITAKELYGEFAKLNFPE